jgi:hypothetical protein
MVITSNYMASLPLNTEQRLSDTPRSSLHSFPQSSKVLPCSDVSLICIYIFVFLNSNPYSFLFLSPLYVSNGKSFAISLRLFLFVLNDSKFSYKLISRFLLATSSLVNLPSKCLLPRTVT